MRTLSNLSPVKWAILSMDGALWRNFSFKEMLPPVGILVAVGFVFLYSRRPRLPLDGTGLSTLFHKYDDINFRLDKQDEQDEILFILLSCNYDLKTIMNQYVTESMKLSTKALSFLQDCALQEMEFWSNGVRS